MSGRVTLLRRELLTAAVSGLAFGAGRDGGNPDVPFPHGRPIVSFALSPSGQLLATGAACSDLHADDALEGVTCWDLQTLEPRWTTKLEGGVGLALQLQGGLRFSPDGRLIGANHHGNALALLEASGGALVRAWAESNDDGPPPWCWSSDPAQPDTVAVLAERRLTLVPRRGPTRAVALPALRPVAFDARGLTLLGHDVLVRGAQRIALSVREGFGVSTAVSETAIAVGTSGGELLVIDRPTFTVRQLLSLSCEALSLSPRGDVVVAILSDRRSAAIVRRGQPEPVPGPLAAFEWLDFPDGRAVATNPEGTRTAALTAAGEIFELGKRPRRLGVVRGASALAWPRDETVVAIGPRVVARLDPATGVKRESRLG